MKLSKEEVKHIALLSRLKLNEQEVEKFQVQLSKILGFVDKLGELDTKGVNPKFQILPSKNVLREDVLGQSLSRKETFLNAPEEKNDFFVVPKVVKK